MKTNRIQLANTAKFPKENIPTLQRFGTKRLRRETKARESPPLAEEVGGLPDNMAEILRAEEVFKVHREEGRPGGEGGHPPERLITRRPIRQRLANYVLMAD